MALLPLFFVTCIVYFLYVKQQHYLCLTLGCLFFLWYEWQSSYWIFTFTHQPIVIASNISATLSPISAAASANESVLNFDAKHNEDKVYSISLKVNQTSFSTSDFARIIFNKNRITINSNPDIDKVLSWQSTLNRTGLWPDIDYTAGCSARKTNWPAKQHLERIESMASLWYQRQENEPLLRLIVQALDYWFAHDFTENDCMFHGGKTYKFCPCGTPGLWNMAWYTQVVVVPRHIGNICLLLLDKLSASHHSQCIKFTSRSYSVIDQQRGSNLLDVAYNGVSLALLLGNNTLILQDALDRACGAAVFASGGADGIQVDGSFLFQDGQLYNGDYGESYLINMLDMFDMMRDVNSVSSSWFPSNETQGAFATLLAGSEWMMIGYNNKGSKRLQPSRLWQYSALGQAVSSFKFASRQNFDVVSVNITQLDQLVYSWLSPSINPVTGTDNLTTASTKPLKLTHPAVQSLPAMVQRLNQTYVSANQGPLTGTRYFWRADYLVHRCHGFVTTLKMVSTRTTVAGCTHGQNLKSGYLSDGSIFTYQHGDDYLDVFSSSRWNSMPGVTTMNTSNNNETTTAAAAMNDMLRCDTQQSRYKGTQAFVGAAVLEQAQMAVAVMNFTDPREFDNRDETDEFGWQKTFLFFPSLYAVQIDSMTTNTTSYENSTLTTTLDQRRRRGVTYVNGKRLLQHPIGGRTYENVTTLWHDKMLYTFDIPVRVTINVVNETIEESSFDTSKGNETVDIWKATVDINVLEPTLTYTVRPNYGLHRHQSDSPALTFISTSAVRGAFSAIDHALALAFWAPASISVPWTGNINGSGNNDDDQGDDGVEVFIETIHPLVVFLQQQVGNGTWVASISDPTQLLSSTTVKISIDQEEVPIEYNVDFPQGPLRGSSVIIVLQDEP